MAFRVLGVLSDSELSVSKRISDRVPSSEWKKKELVIFDLNFWQHCARIGLCMYDNANLCPDHTSSIPFIIPVFFSSPLPFLRNTKNRGLLEARQCSSFNWGGGVGGFRHQSISGAGWSVHEPELQVNTRIYSILTPS